MYMNGAMIGLPGMMITTPYKRTIRVVEQKETTVYCAVGRGTTFQAMSAPLTAEGAFLSGLTTLWGFEWCGGTINLCPFIRS